MSLKFLSLKFLVRLSYIWADDERLGRFLSHCQDLLQPNVVCSNLFWADTNIHRTLIGIRLYVEHKGNLIS